MVSTTSLVQLKLLQAQQLDIQIVALGLWIIAKDQILLHNLYTLSNERDQFGLIPSFARKQFAQMGFSYMGYLWDKNAGKWLSWTTLNQYQRDQLVDSPTFTTNFQMFPDYCLI